MRFQFILPKAQRSFVGFYFRQKPTEVRGLLSRHPAMLIQIDGLIGHGLRISYARRIKG